MIYDVIVVGAGHNGLACACYLARAGLRVLVVEQAGAVGGAVHTAQTIAAAPGYHFDTCSVVHNLINMSTIPAELDLAAAGLSYRETDPFITVFRPADAPLRLWRSVERTCAEIEQRSPADAAAYARLIARATPVVDLALGTFRSSADNHRWLPELGRRLRGLGQVVGHGPLRLTAELLQPYGALLDELFSDEATRLGLAALAAHGTLGPQTPGTAFFAFWQAAYHRYGNWHAVGGSGALSEALARRLISWNGEIRIDSAVRAIEVAGRARGVILADGERIAARAVVAAINPQTTLLQLVDPALLPAHLRARLRARHRSNAIQFVVHVALRGLPPWPDAPAGCWRSMQLVAASVAQIQQNFLEAEAGLAPRDPAVYLYTMSALDPGLAPPGGHTAYLASASYPARWADGGSWDERGQREAERLVEVVERRAPGFRERIVGMAWRTPEDWQRINGLLGGHPMHLDITLDQAGPLRPLRELAGYRTPIPGLYVSGAGTPPAGGVAGIAGRAAARVVLRDWPRS